MEPEKIVLVLGHDSELVKEAVSDYPVETVIQEPQLGTGHAVLCCEDAFRDFSGDILILSGDVPAISFFLCASLRILTRKTERTSP